MAKTVLLLGVRADLLETVQQELQAPGVEFLSGTGEADVEPALRKADVDHVIIGGGLDLEARAAMVRTVFQSSGRATVHMKDQLSGPEGFLPFVKAVLGGLSSYEPSGSPDAILRAGALAQTLDKPTDGRGFAVLPLTGSLRHHGLRRFSVPARRQRPGQLSDCRPGRCGYLRT